MLGRRDAPLATPSPGDGTATRDATPRRDSHAQRAPPLHRYAFGSRSRSQSENTLGQLSVRAGPINAGGGGLMLDSDEEEERDRADPGRGAGSITPPLDIGGGGGASGNATQATASASFAPVRSRFGRREFFMQGRDSPRSSDDEDAEIQMYSTSYAGPRDLSNFTFEMVQMTGYLEKQSTKNPDVWKRRWFVMQESALFFYRSESDAIDTKPSDRTCCGTIPLDSVHSVTTAKDYGVGAFQIRVSERKYILRADTKECMHDWLFNFQKSIANIISVLLRSKSDHRFHRVNLSSSRRSFSKVSRSVSLDYQEYTDYGRMSADFPSHHFQYGLLDAETFSDDSVGENTSSRASPRRASSPLSFSQYGPRSPVAMFAFDPPFEAMGADEGQGVGDFYAGNNGPLIEGKEDEDDDHDHDTFPPTATAAAQSSHPSPSPPTTSASPMLTPTFSPPVSTGKYIPRFLRDRQAAEASAPPPPPSDATSPPRPSPPLRSSLSWLMRGSRDNYAICTNESETVYFDDNKSFTAGSESHGVTSLIGVRNKLEDVCCCVPDLNDYLQTDEYAKHSLYALFDGHCGVRAAQYLDEKLLKYLCEHEAFMSNARQAFHDSFKRIDDEFLARATAELMGDGSTAAVVLIRGNKLLTANVGDSRAVVSVNGVALDVIEEQTPGRPDERARIERLGGWVKEERELQMSKLHSMDLSDPWIQQKAERVVRWVSVYRVNGELAVSRAIGDMDYKGKALTDYQFWGFPEGHDRQFRGDLVVCEPEFKEIEITPEVHFLVLACDGLWDTITSQEAVNHVKEKIAEGYTTSQLSHSLADLAIRSGSSDNVSVIVVLFQH